MTVLLAFSVTLIVLVLFAAFLIPSPTMGAYVVNVLVITAALIVVAVAWLCYIGAVVYGWWKPDLKA